MPNGVVIPTWRNYIGGRPEFAGTSPSGLVSVYYDPSLDPQVQQNANDFLHGADSVVSQIQQIFNTPPSHVNVILYAIYGQTNGSGGGIHGGCDYQTGANIEICVAYGQPNVELALFAAELSENHMKGQLCQFSTGEALSRRCAAEVVPGTVLLTPAAPVWITGGMYNWVDETEPTDLNLASIGCGMAFLSWLRRPLRFSLSSIAQTIVSFGNAGTLDRLYARLTRNSASDAWPEFTRAIQTVPAGVRDDFPFG